MTCAFGFTLICFLGFHYGLVRQNRTTIEAGDFDKRSVVRNIILLIFILFVFIQILKKNKQTNKQKSLI